MGEKMAADAIPENVRFSGLVRLDEGTLREVQTRYYRPFAIFGYVFCAMILACALIVCAFKGQAGTPFLIGACFATIIIQAERHYIITRNTRLMVEREAEMARQMPDLFTPEREFLFTDEGIYSKRTGNTTPYSDVRNVMESQRFVILVLPGAICIPVIKDSLQGGTPDEFKQFISEKRSATR